MQLIFFWGIKVIGSEIYEEKVSVMTVYLLSLIAVTLLMTNYFKDYYSLKLLTVGNILLGLSFLLVLNRSVDGALMVWHLSVMMAAWFFWIASMKAVRGDDVPQPFYGGLYCIYLLTSSWLHYEGYEERIIYVLITVVMVLVLFEAFYRELNKWRENQVAITYISVAFFGFTTYWLFSSFSYVQWMNDFALAGSVVTNLAIMSMLMDRNHKIIERTAMLDALTGAYNRKYFIKHLEGVLESARRDHEGFCVAMIGIDDFRTINFSHGHRYADKVLREFKEIVDNNLRHYDLFARYDSEKFLFFFKEKDLDKGYYILDRILIDLRLKEWDDEELMVTFSGSIMGINERTKALEPLEVIDLLERQLMVAKDQGKNRILKKDNPLNNGDQ